MIENDPNNGSARQDLQSGRKVICSGAMRPNAGMCPCYQCLVRWPSGKILNDGWEFERWTWVMAFRAEGKAWGKGGSQKVSLFQHNSLVWQWNWFYAWEQAAQLGKWTQVRSKRAFSAQLRLKV